MSLLDDIVLSSALNQARRLLEQGFDAETAAESACPGAWRIYRQRVLDKLLTEKKIKARQAGPRAKPRPR
jgi:hypothetical protein